MSTVLDSIPPSHSQHCPKHDFNVSIVYFLNVEIEYKMADRH